MIKPESCRLLVVFGRVCLFYLFLVWFLLEHITESGRNMTSLYMTQYEFPAMLCYCPLFLHDWSPLLTTYCDYPKHSCHTATHIIGYTVRTFVHPLGFEVFLPPNASSSLTWCSPFQTSFPFLACPWRVLRPSLGTWLLRMLLLLLTRSRSFPFADDE